MQICAAPTQSKKAFPTFQMAKMALTESSFSGHQHFIIFTDDATRLCWVFLLKRRDEEVKSSLGLKTVWDVSSDAKSSMVDMLPILTTSYAIILS